MKHPSSLLLCLLVVVHVQVRGQGSAQLIDEADEGAIADTGFPFINMLEFLGEFETEQGDWVSPDILENDAFADLDANPDDIADRNPGRTASEGAGASDE